jgi:hypothetical protein
MPNYGPFEEIVSVSIAGIGAISAVLLAWKRRSNWEPAEEDVPTAGQKVAGVMALVAVAYVYITITSENYSRFIYAAIALGLSLLISLLVYIFLISTCTYEGESSKKLIGGLWTTTFAKNQLSHSTGETLQNLLLRFQFDKDKIWPRQAQAFAKILFTLAYVGLIFCGTVAITLVAQILLARSAPPIRVFESSIVAPLDGTSAIAGLIRLHWNFPTSPELHNLHYEIQTDSNGVASTLPETRQNVSVRIEPGTFRWRVKAIWDDSRNVKSSEGPWQTIKVYSNTLERIRATKRIKIGQSEGYTRTNRIGGNGKPENFWTVWLPQVLHREFGINVEPEIVVAPWLDQTGRNTYLHLLDQDPSIDILASGLTILPERERDYGVKFSAPIGVYRAMLVSRKPIKELSGPIRLAATAQTTNEHYARQLARIAPDKWRFEEPDDSITGPDVYTELLKALESDRVDALIIDQPYLLALERDASLKLQFEYLEDAIKETNGRKQIVPIPEEKIGVVTRIEDHSLRNLLQRYAAESFTKNLWNNFYPGPPK